MRRVFSMRQGIVVGLLLALALGRVTALAAGAISQPFASSSSSLNSGMLASFAPAGSNVVQPAAAGGTGGLVGVVTSASLVQLSSTSSHTVQVAVAGVANALVSDINGPVAVGDKIEASPISGVGMKARTAGEIIGTAEASLTSVDKGSESVTDLSGRKSTVNVGLIPLAIHIEYYTGPSSGNLASYVPPLLQDIANAFTGRSVSPWRVLAAAIAFLLGFVMVAVMLMTGIRSGLISIGRNPLARGALLNGLLDIIIAALGVLAVTLAAVYALLIV